MLNAEYALKAVVLVCSCWDCNCCFAYFHSDFCCGLCFVVSWGQSSYSLVPNEVAWVLKAEAMKIQLARNSSSQDADSRDIQRSNKWVLSYFSHPSPFKPFWFLAIHQEWLYLMIKDCCRSCPYVIQSQPAKERITYNLFSWIFDGLTGPVDFSVGYISASESFAESFQKMLV